MKKEYIKPIIEVVTFNFDVATISGPAGGDSDGEQDVSDWYDKK